MLVAKRVRSVPPEPGESSYVQSGTCTSGLVLVAGASCTVIVAFDPSAVGASAASLKIGSGTVASSGTGTDGGTTDAPLPLWICVDGRADACPHK